MSKHMAFFSFNGQRLLGRDKLLSDLAKVLLSNG